MPAFAGMTSFRPKPESGVSAKQIEEPKFFAVIFFLLILTYYGRNRMEREGKTLVINAAVEISANALEAIVENAKRMTGRNEKGHYRVDTAGKVGEMISRFLSEKDFESYAQNPENYR